MKEFTIEETTSEGNWLNKCRSRVRTLNSLFIFVALLAGCWTAWLPNARALGVRVPNQDAAAIARGNAFAATADNPAAIYYNPAGISQLDGNNIQAGSLVYLGIYADYESPSGQEIENHAEVLPVPNIFYTHSLKDTPLSFGFGAYEPFGFSVKWPNDVPFRTAGVEASLAYLTLNPVIALKPHPTFSIALGPTFNYSKIDLQQGVFQSPNVVPGDRFEFKGEGWGYGFNFGVQWQPHPQW
jgi:long-chain fatty acid transport protein